MDHTPGGDPSLSKLSPDELTLDPADWDATRALAHRMVDDAMDHLRDVRDRHVWQ